MKIQVTRQGGFAGGSDVIADVDTMTTDKSTARTIESAVRDARFFELPAAMKTDEVGADLYQYEVTVQDSDKKHAVRFAASDPSKAGSLSKLLQVVTQQS